MTTPVGGYVRHRSRMVRESVYQDLSDTLIRTRWLIGISSDAVETTTANAMALLEDSPLVLIDYFPDSEEGPAVTPLNTFALDIGEQGEMVEGEMGGFFEQPYTFNMAFYAKTDAVAMALMSDLRDRYLGLSDSPFVSLFDYNSPTPQPRLVVRMEVDNFRYARDTQNVAPHEVHLFFAALEITDYVDQERPA